MSIIGITGYKRSGKDSVASALAVHQFERVAFADALKSMALAIDPQVSTRGSRLIPFNAGYAPLTKVVNRYGWEVAKSAPQVREFLQRLGTEGVREHLGENAWVQALELKLVDGKNYAVADCRFPNEVAWVKSEILGVVCEVSTHCARDHVSAVSAALRK